jgi:cytochrome P450
VEEAILLAEHHERGDPQVAQPLVEAALGEERLLLTPRALVGGERHLLKAAHDHVADVAGEVEAGAERVLVAVADRRVERHPVHELAEHGREPEPRHQRLLAEIAVGALVEDREPLDQLTPSLAHRDGDRGAERMPHEQGRVHVEALEGLDHGAGLALERVVAERLGGPAVAEQVHAHDAMVGGQQRREAVEPVHRAGEAVQQHGGRRAALALVEHVQVALARGDQSARPSAGRARLASDRGAVRGERRGDPAERESSSSGPHAEHSRVESRVMALPPGPRVPGVVQTAAFLHRPIDFLERCQRRYGDCFRARFQGIGEVVYIADPADVERVFKGSPADFHAGEANATMFEPVLGRLSSMTLDEDAHLRRRKLLLPPFHGDAMKRWSGAFVEVAEREVARWPVGEPFALLPAMRRITMESILRVVMGVSDPRRLDEMAAGILRLDRLAGIVLPLPPLQRDLGRFSPWRRFVAARDAMDALVYREIAERRESPDPAGDVVSLMIASRYEDGSAMTDRELRDEMYALLAAGHETSSTSLTWCFERILRTPRVLDRLLAEPDDDAYVDAVIKETLRVRSPVTDATRILTRATELGGYTLPAGTQVVIALPLLHLREGAYADPHEFRPERWLEGDGAPYTFVAFGGGVRRCIGASFANLEMRTVLRTVLARATLRADSPQPEGQRLHHVVVVPTRGGRVVLDARRAAPAPAEEAVPA